MIARVRLLLGISVFWLALSLLFDGLNTLVLPHHLLGLTDSDTQATTLGLLTFVGILAGMLVQPVAGVLSDRLRPRWGRRRVIAVGVLLIVASLVVFGSSRSLLVVFVGYLMAQVSASVAQAAQQGFIPDLVPGRWRGTAAGAKGFMDLAGAFLAFAVLGRALGAGGTTSALLIVAAIVVVLSLLTAVLVREPRQLVEAGHTPSRVTLADAFRLDLRQQRAFAWLVVARFLFLLGTYAVGRFFLFFVADRLGLAPDRAAEEAAMLLAGLTLITALGAPLAGSAADHFGRKPLMLVGAILSAVGVAALPLATDASLILLFGALMSLGSAAFASANWALTADLVPPAEAARFFGLANFGTAGAAAAAGLFGPLVDAANRSASGSGYTLLFIIAGLLFVVSAVALRGVAAAERPTVPQPESELAGEVLASARRS
jgi:MFS family permease